MQYLGLFHILPDETTANGLGSALRFLLLRHFI
jgi:hypothetical protein